MPVVRRDELSGWAGSCRANPPRGDLRQLAGRKRASRSPAQSVRVASTDPGVVTVALLEWGGVVAEPACGFPAIANRSATSSGTWRHGEKLAGPIAALHRDRSGDRADAREVPVHRVRVGPVVCSQPLEAEHEPYLEEGEAGVESAAST